MIPLNKTIKNKPQFEKEPQNSKNIKETKHPVYNWNSVYKYWSQKYLPDPEMLALELCVSDTSLIDPNHFRVSVEEVLSELLFSPTMVLELVVITLLLVLAALLLLVVRLLVLLLLPLPIPLLPEMLPLDVTTLVKFVILLAVERSFWDQWCDWRDNRSLSCRNL